MSYRPARLPLEARNLAEALQRELERLSGIIDDTADVVLYRTLPDNQGSLTAGVSANWKMASGNVVRISTSNTVTITGIAYKTPKREVVLINVGTGVLVMKSDDAASSASYRFLLSSTWNLSANAAAVIWYDPYSSRHRGIART